MTHTNTETLLTDHAPSATEQDEVMSGATALNRTDPHDVLSELSETMDAYRADPRFHKLILDVAEEREVDVQGVIDEKTGEAGTLNRDNFFEDEDVFMAVAQQALDFRKGGGRNDIKATALSETTKASLADVKDLLGMNKNTVPENPNADMVFVLGGAGATPANRLQYTLDMIERGELNTNVIVMVGCERPMILKKNPAGLNELDRAGAAATNTKGESAKTEFDLMLNTAEKKIGLDDADKMEFTGLDPRVPAEHNYQREWKVTYFEKGDLNVFVTSAPMLGRNRFSPSGDPRDRSNTGDTLKMMGEMNRDVNPDEPIHMVCVTDAIFTSFQEPDAKGALALFGISCEAVGYNREYAGLDEWPGGDALYIQEALSALRQTRAARDTLARQLSDLEQAA